MFITIYYAIISIYLIGLATAVLNVMIIPYTYLRIRRNNSDEFLINRINLFYFNQHLHLFLYKNTSSFFNVFLFFFYDTYSHANYISAMYNVMTIFIIKINH